MSWQTNPPPMEQHGAPPTGDVMLSTACRVRASCTLCSTHLWGPTHAVFCDWLAGARQRVCVCGGGG